MQYVPVFLVVAAAAVGPMTGALYAQIPPPPSAAASPAPQEPGEQVMTYARLFVAISQLRDRAQARLAEPRNKTDEAQTEIRKSLREGIDSVFRASKVEPAEYDRFVREIATDPERRRTFDVALARLSGRPD
ncbi:MAG: hypothetical protein ACT4OZ_18075 [Gemmatimonadota bacterium]